MDHSSPSDGTAIKICQININGQSISYSLRPSLRARHVRLVIKRETGLTIVHPLDYNIGRLPSLLKEKSAWILKNLARNSQSVRNDDTRVLRDGSCIPYLGRQLKIVKMHLPTLADSVRLDGDHLFINLNNHKIKLNRVVEWWYRKQAADLVPKKVAELGSRLRISYGRISIKKVKTRWGSCSHQGNLNFNWKLIMIPEPVVDYVIIHELCHRKEMNHSQKFWQLVGQYCPDWRQHRQWLKLQSF
jgi:predicted metal-dependent hydrolase